MLSNRLIIFACVAFALTSISVKAQSLHASKLQVYTIDTRDKEDKTEVRFISMSDYVRVIEHPDSTLIPSKYIGLSGQEAKKRVELVDEFRTRFFERANLTENDSLFVYNYASDEIFRFALKELKVVGFVNHYWGGNDHNIREYEYQIGFEVSDQKIGGFAFFGSNNPFVKGKIKPIQWKAVEPSEFPSQYSYKRDLGRMPKAGVGATYVGEFRNLIYYLQNTSEEEWTSARRVAVINKYTKELVFQTMLYAGESADFAPLNGIQTMDFDDKIQWAGQLFKNQPDVIFGLMWQSFGCPSIYVMNQNFHRIYIGCDNRH